MISPPNNEPRIIKLSMRLYGWLLHLGPKEFRQEYGQEVLKDFRHCCRNAYMQDSICGVLRLWLSMFTSAIVDMGKEHFSEMVRREEKHLSRDKQTKDSLIDNYAEYTPSGIAWSKELYELLVKEL